MSSSTDASDAVAVAEFDSLYIAMYCVVASSVLFIYETVVTFDREVACFWHPKWAGAPLLFFANKWISMTVSVMMLAVFASFPSDQRFVTLSRLTEVRALAESLLTHAVYSCSWFSVGIEAIIILQFVPVAVFSALRVYVLSNRSKPLGVLILVLSLAPVGANLVTYGYDLSGDNYPPFGCLETDFTTNAINFRLRVPQVVLISRVPLIVADMLLIYVTWTKLNHRNVLHGIQPSKRPSLSDIFYKDGIMYFVVLFLLNVLHLILSALSIEFGAGGGGYVTKFTPPLTAILTSRFLLDIQEANHAELAGVDRDDPWSGDSSHGGTSASFFSSLGAFINPDLTTSVDGESDFHDAGSRSGGEEDAEIQVSERQAGVASFMSPASST